MSESVVALLQRAKGDVEAGWSMGSFGALAEFHQDENDELVVDATDKLIRATRRGAIALEAAAVSEAIPIAYEMPSARPNRWSHGIALCFPEADAAFGRREVLTEIGPDKSAVRSEDRWGILFDLGLKLPQSDFCIRTSDAELLSVLRKAAGRSIFDMTNPAMGAIMTKHPHRVALTKLGRIEVFQKIGGPDTGGISPPGPHTHVLPKLLMAGRTHSANIPIPEGLVPCAFLHPGHPLTTTLGADRKFEQRLHNEFQQIYRRYAPQELIDVKETVFQALRSEGSPLSLANRLGRHQRATLRVALRQARSCPGTVDGVPTELISAWASHFDRAVEAEDGDGVAEHQ